MIELRIENQVGGEHPVGDTPPFASTREALGMLRTVLSYLGAGAAEMAAQAQAECLQELEQLDAVKTATRAEIPGAFTAAQGYSADGDYSPRSWLMHWTKVTRGATAWARVTTLPHAP
jgi:hypothetical protein